MSIKYLISILPLLAVGADAAAAAKCTKNQCYAQVSANRFAPPAFRSSGCFSYLASTVTLPAATVTKTVAEGFDRVTPGPACATTAAPASVVPAYASSCAGDAQYVSACQCFGIMRSTTTLKRCTTTVLRTTTTTAALTTVAGGTTTFAVAPAPTGCSNQGMNFAVYDNAAVDQQTGYYNFDPTALTNPLYVGTVGQIQSLTVPNEQDQAAIYGQYVRSSNGFALNHAGYLFAPQSGTYTFSASNIDDVFNFWIGENAFSGFNRENDNLDTFYYFSTGPTLQGTYTGIAGAASYTVQLVGGLYYPFRYVYAQSTGPATFSFAITAPDGTQLFGSSQPNSAYLVRFSCDGALAPAFPQFSAVAPVTTTIAGTSPVTTAATPTVNPTTVLPFATTTTVTPITPTILPTVTIPTTALTVG